MVWKGSNEPRSRYGGSRAHYGPVLAYCLYRAGADYPKRPHKPSVSLLEIASILALILSTAALVALLVLSIYREKAVQFIQPFVERTFPEQLAARIVNLLNTFIEGLLRCKTHSPMSNW